MFSIFSDLGTYEIDERYVYKTSVEVTEGKIPLGRCKHSWESNIKMGLNEIWFESVDGIQVVQ
jgi:hypothetical protein